jgi:cerevisin
LVQFLIDTNKQDFKTGCGLWSLSPRNIVQTHNMTFPKRLYSLLTCLACSVLLASANFVDFSSRPREGHYIIVLKEHVDATGAFEHIAWVESQKFTRQDWMHTTVWDPPRLFSIPEEDGTPLMGYSIRLNPEHALELSNDESVESIELDQIVQIHPVRDETERNSTWALARVTKRMWDDSTKDASSFRFDVNDGQGVTAYVIDTGVNIRHSEFEGRASYGKSFIKDYETGEPQDADDGNGHGSHVSSLIAGKTYGVAPKASIVAVRVLDENGSGSMSDVIAGIGWVVKEHLKKGRSSLSVINMSLGSMQSRTVDRAVNGAVAAGVHVVVASGNSHDDACRYSPAGASDLISVGATDKDDQVAFFSNFGKCVHVFAPGHQITGAWLGDGTQTISGTSMASPMVAGIVSTLLSREGYVKPKTMRNTLKRIGTVDALKKMPDSESPNVLGYTCFGEETKTCKDSKKRRNRPEEDNFDLFDFVSRMRNVQRKLFSRNQE